MPRPHSSSSEYPTVHEYSTVCRDAQEQKRPDDLHLKYKYGSGKFWCRGYFVDTVGKNAKMIEEYIQNQLEEDLASDQITLKKYIDPFTGSKRKQAKENSRF